MSRGIIQTQRINTHDVNDAIGGVRPVSDSSWMDNLHVERLRPQEFTGTWRCLCILFSLRRGFMVWVLIGWNCVSCHFNLACFLITVERIELQTWCVVPCCCWEIDQYALSDGKRVGSLPVV